LKPVFFHVDVNSAFLSWSAAYRVGFLGEKTDLRNIPSVVGGNEKNRHGIVLAKSTPAKKFGIKTGEALVAARNKCPGLVVIPPDYELYVRSSRALIDLLGRYTDRVQQYSIDEAFADMTGCSCILGSPAVFAGELKEIIKAELGFTVNIGISSCKFLAKMASDFEKPDKVHTLFPDEIPSKMWPLPVEDMFFVGRSGTRRLNGLGIHTIGELAATDHDILVSHFGKYGDMIWNFAHGEDHSFAFSAPEESKGYGNSVTVPSDILTKEDAMPVLLSLCETVGARLRADKAKASVIGISIVDSDFNFSSHQRRLPSPTSTTMELFVCARALFGQLWKKDPIRQLGVHTSDVTHESAYQYNLFDGDKYDRLSRLDAAIDTIREKYGEDSVMRATFLDHPDQHMTGGINKARRNGLTKKVKKLPWNFDKKDQ